MNDFIDNDPDGGVYQSVEKERKMFSDLDEKTCCEVSNPGALFRPGERVRYIRRAQIRHGEPEFYPCIVSRWDPKLNGYIVILPEITGEGIWLSEKIVNESHMIRW